MSTPHINYSVAYYNFYGPGQIDDTLHIFLSNGSDQILIDQFIPPNATMAWVNRSIAVPSDIALTNTMNLILRISDLGSDVNITEVLFDKFYTSNNFTESLTELTKQVYIFPNPTNNTIEIVNAPMVEYRIYNTFGKLVKRGVHAQEKIDVSELKSGVYFVQFEEYYLKFIKK